MMRLLLSSFTSSIITKRSGSLPRLFSSFASDPYADTLKWMEKPHKGIGG